MPVPMLAPLPRDLDLDAGWTIRVTALNSVTGATVSGVTVSNVMIMAQSLGGAITAQGDFVPLPLLTPETP